MSVVRVEYPETMVSRKQRTWHISLDLLTRLDV